MLKFLIMYFESLKIFCDVVRQRSFSRAATVNRISQSAASQNVSQLEKTLGVQLIDRSQRPFKLTPEGEVYYDGCKALVERYYAVEAEVKKLSDEVIGTVSVAAIYSVGLSSMSAFVQQFVRRFPRAHVQLAYLHPHRVRESVLDEEVDIGLISYPQASKGLTVIPWRNEPMVLVCHPEHEFASRSEIKARDLNDVRFVAFEEDLQIRREIDRQLRKHRVTVDAAMAFDNIETIKRAVEINEGISILPEPSIVAEIRSGSLIAVPLTSPSMVRPLGIIHRKNNSLPRAVEEFINLVRISGEGQPDNNASVESSTPQYASRSTAG